jgi:hypothetical protein
MGSLCGFEGERHVVDDEVPIDFDLHGDLVAVVALAADNHDE